MATDIFLHVPPKVVSGAEVGYVKIREVRDATSPTGRTGELYIDRYREYAGTPAREVVPPDAIGMLCVDKDGNMELVTYRTVGEALVNVRKLAAREARPREF